MKPIRSFHVSPDLPEPLHALENLAYNIRWSWDHETINLFRRLDHDLWEQTYHNPVRMLGTISQERLEVVARDAAFMANLERVETRLREYVENPSTWYRRAFGSYDRPEVAYFSMEFGLTECLPVYSGGLGILAADHLKSGSDLGVPLVGVGLLYQKGYFRQYLNPDGWQQESYPVNDFHVMPVRPFLDDAGLPVRITVDIAGRPTIVQLWKVEVGRIVLVLLDSNVPENPQDLQDITDELYGGDDVVRIRQEILLGIGGMRALDRLGLRTRVYHMNEGHCAFLALERIRLNMREHGLDFHEAREVVAASTVFTTHTPVPAGIDIFDADLVERHFESYREELGLDRESFLALGRIEGRDDDGRFNMAVLALRTSCFANGVSRLHGEVARGMWRDAWPDVPLDELPIVHVTNGVHPGSWISDDMRYLYDRYLGPGWGEEPGDTAIWVRSEQIPGEELWRTHERRRERLVAFARRRLHDQLEKRGSGRAALDDSLSVLDSRALTIGFARRFATYKRGNLLLRDPDRLARILNAADRPVQIIYAGKAHPKDDQGKALVREIVHLAGRPEFRHRVVFLEDYDAVVARYLLQGVDVWLNTPRRPMEASGTSGMKAAFNGALNLSIPDGWWAEGGSPRTGWTIGRGESYQDLEYQDRVEADTLYDLLEREVVPLFYDRGVDRLPRGWIELMKNALNDLCPVFSSNRMLEEYTVEGYRPAMERRDRFEEDDFKRARGLAAWREEVHREWGKVRVLDIEVETPERVRVGAEFEVRVWVDPGKLGADDLAVQAYVGRVDDDQQIVDPEIVDMDHDVQAGGDGVLFRGVVKFRCSGLRGFTVRVLPHHDDLPHAHCATRILWAGREPS